MVKVKYFFQQPRLALVPSIVQSVTRRFIVVQVSVLEPLLLACVVNDKFVLCSVDDLYMADAF